MKKNKILLITIALIISQAYLSIQLIGARHELRAMRGEFALLQSDVEDHDGTIEQITDDMDAIAGGK